MPTPKQMQAIENYGRLLEEEKLRIAAIERALSGATGLPSPFVREFCFLQLRILCELIALGCLTAHGDIQATQTKRLTDEYAADSIIKQLEKLHPNFYPEAADQDPQDRLHIIKAETGFLTKAELLTLYGKCGEVLHRGSVKRLLTPQMPIQKNFPDIVEWGRKINVLLRLHVISLIDGKTGIICMLRDSLNNNKAQVAIFEGYEPPSPAGEPPNDHEKAG